MPVKEHKIEEKTIYVWICAASKYKNVFDFQIIAGFKFVRGIGVILEASTESKLTLLLFCTYFHLVACTRKIGRYLNLQFK